MYQRGRSLFSRFLIFAFVLLLIVPSIALAFKEVKFAVISDPHLSLPVANTENKVKMEDSSVELFREAINKINSISGLDFVILTGDLTKDVEPWNIDLLREMLEEVNVPVFAVLGNHEVSPLPVKGKDPSLASLIGDSKYTIIWALQGYGFNGPRSYWSAEPIPGLYLIGLDTTKIGSWGGKLSKAQLEWLDKELYKNKDKLTIVIGHHLLVPFRKEELKPEWKNFYLDNAEEVIKLFERYPQVSFYLCGHRHVSTVPVEKNGIWYIVNASTLTYPMSITIYTLTPEELKYEVIRLEATKDIWEVARKTMGEDPWWKPHKDATVEETLAYYEAKEFMKFSMPVRFKKK
ncbi:MAG: metallophosphoesterase [Synergistetes bacterium]|nr:metallophosphoesterase [Synergistota bacterium]MDW8191712.1 metallophosphoesterase [Synergistota bacterium]